MYEEEVALTGEYLIIPGGRVGVGVARQAVQRVPLLTTSSLYGQDQGCAMCIRPNLFDSDPDPKEHFLTLINFKNLYIKTKSYLGPGCF